MFTSNIFKVKIINVYSNVIQWALNDADGLIMLRYSVAYENKWYAAQTEKNDPLIGILKKGIFLVVNC